MNTSVIDAQLNKKYSSFSFNVGIHGNTAVVKVKNITTKNSHVFSVSWDKSLINTLVSMHGNTPESYMVDIISGMFESQSFYKNN